MKVGDDGLTETAPGNGEKDVGGRFPPDDVVLGAGRGHGREQEGQVILSGQLLYCGNKRAKPKKNLNWELIFQVEKFRLPK